MKSASALLAILPTIYAQAPQVLGAGIDLECDNALHVVYEYPAFFSTVYESAATIFNFMGGTNSLVITNPPQTVITSTMLTTTVTTTATTTATITSGGNAEVSATIGAGLPSGTVTSIPSTSPFALAYFYDAVLASRSPSGFSTGNGTSDDPADAGFWYIQDGQLRSLNGSVVGRNASDKWAAIVPSTDHNDMTTNFTFVYGVLHWDSPDKGPATFYNCGGSLYAGFPDAPFSNCTEVTVGGLSKTVVDALTASRPTSSTTSQTTSRAPISTSRASTSSGESGSMYGASSSTSEASSSTSSGASSSRASASTGTTTRSSSSNTSGAGTTSVATTPGGSGSTSTSSSASTTTSGTSADVTCPNDDNTLVEGYVIFCGKGFNAVNIGSYISAASLQACINVCTGTPLCVGVTFDNSGHFCYLHSTPHSSISDSSGQYDSAELADDSSSSTTSSTTSGVTSSTTSDNGGAGPTTTTMTTTIAGDGSGGTTTTTTSSSSTTSDSTGVGSGGISDTDDCPVSTDGDIVDGYRIYCDQVVDPVINTNTITPAQTDIATIGDCAALCDTTDGCTGLSYIKDSTTCYLHTGDNQEPTSRTGWIGAIKVGDEPGSSTTTTSVADGAGGAGSSTTTTTTIEMGGGGGSTTTTSSASSSTTSSTGTGGSGGEDICPETEFGAEVNGYEIYCGYAVDPVDDNNVLDRDPTPDDIATFGDCLTLCDTYDECTGVSYYSQGTTCYLHGGDNHIRDDLEQGPYDGAARVNPPSGSGGTSTTTTTAGSGSGSITTTSSSSSTTTASTGGSGNTFSDPECSTEDGSISPGGVEYEVFCGQALTSRTTVGGAPQEAASLSDCVELCDSYVPVFDRCISVSWANTGPHFCYLHTDADEGSDEYFTDDQGYHSAILNDGTNGDDPCLAGPGGDCVPPA